MSVFNPEHTLHPPGHAVHMSGMGTTASCQCLIPSWICLNQTHAWIDICAPRLCCMRRRPDCCCCFVFFLWQFPHAQHAWTPFRKHLLLPISRPMWSNRTFATIPQSTVNTLCEGVTLTEYVNSLTCHILNHNVWYITVFPRQQPSPRPSQHFATCHIFPLPRIKNRC